MGNHRKWDKLKSVDVSKEKWKDALERYRDCDYAAEMWLNVAQQGMDDTGFLGKLVEIVEGYKGRKVLIAAKSGYKMTS